MRRVVIKNRKKHKPQHKFVKPKPHLESGLLNAQVYRDDGIKLLEIAGWAAIFMFAMFLLVIWGLMLVFRA